MNDVDTARKPMVHVIGWYLPKAFGKDAREEETAIFRRLWDTCLSSLATVTFVSSSRGASTRFNDAYVSQKMQEGDIAVYLNQLDDIGFWRAKARFVALVEKVTRKIGRERSVIAMQDADNASAIKYKTRSLPFSIDYSSMNGISGDGDLLYQPFPVPEQAIGIVRAILRGERPDVAFF